MTQTEAQNNIGQPFKVTALHGGIMGQFDTIRAVDESGMIQGDYTEAHCGDCRLKGEQPAQLRAAAPLVEQPATSTGLNLLF